MSKYTKKDIMHLAEDEGVEFIRLQFTDLFGTLKNTLNREWFDNSENHILKISTPFYNYVF